MPSKKSHAKKSSARKEASTVWRDRLHYFEARQQEMVEAARDLVEIESPSDNKPAGDRLGAFLAEKFRVMGGETRLHRTETYADHLQVNFPGRGNAAPVLLLGHFDTVYPLGTLATMLCGVAGDRLHGPGVLDMKAGIVLMMEAIAALKTWHGDLPRPVTVFLVSDEEVGSNSSRAITEALARESAAVLVLNPQPDSAARSRPSAKEWASTR